MHITLNLKFLIFKLALKLLKNYDSNDIDIEYFCNVYNNHGNTALIIACKESLTDVAMCLLTTVNININIDICSHSSRFTQIAIFQ